MAKQITITVDRERLEDLIKAAHNDYARNSSIVTYYALEQIKAALPEPEWEPNQTLIKAYIKAVWGTKASDNYYWNSAVNSLKRLHNEGIDFSVRS